MRGRSRAVVRIWQASICAQRSPRANTKPIPARSCATRNSCRPGSMRRPSPVFGMERIARPLQDVRGRIAHAMRDTNEALCTYARCAMRRTCAVSSRARGGQNAAGAFPPGTARRNSAGSTSIQIWRVCLDGDWQRRADANEVCPPSSMITTSWRAEPLTASHSNRTRTRPPDTRTPV